MWTRILWTSIVVTSNLRVLHCHAIFTVASICWWRISPTGCRGSLFATSKVFCLLEPNGHLVSFQSVFFHLFIYLGLRRYHVHITQMFKDYFPPQFNCVKWCDQYLVVHDNIVFTLVVDGNLWALPDSSTVISSLFAPMCASTKPLFPVSERGL